MAHNGDTQLNLSVLQRLDKSISSIVDSASQVALYKFSSSNEWEKTEIEGTLFVYMRSRQPQHGFIVMNRVNTTNFIEHITNELEFQLQIPFLLYRNGKGDIHGIWFYEQEQCKNITQLIQGLSNIAVTQGKMSADKMKQLSSHQSPKRSNNLEKMDIMSLLTRAQEEYDKRAPDTSGSPVNAKRNGPQKGKIFKPMPIRMNGFHVSNGVESVPITVDKLFAQVGDGKHVFLGSNNKSPSVKQADNSPRSRSYSSTNSKQVGVKLPSGEDILQKLMAKPIAENNQRSGHRARAATYSSEPLTLDSQTSVEMVELDLKKKLNILPSCERVSPAVHPKADLLPQPDPLLESMKISRTEAVDIPVLTPAMLELSSSLPSSSTSRIDLYKKNLFNNDDFIASSLPKTILQKPLSSTPLLSPMDFKVSIKNSSSSLDESPPSPPELRSSLVHNSLHCFSADESNQELLLPQTLIQNTNSAHQSSAKPLGVTPLTKNQLREALTFMIQNDGEFINQLHESYLKSLRCHLNGYKSS